MHTLNHIYHDNGQEFHGYIAYDKALAGPRPAVLVVHDWTGRNEFACEKAKLLAQMGYVGFAVDMYGHGQLGSTTEEKQALMNPLVSDQKLLRRRIQAGLTAACSMSEVDSKRVAVIGFCFGGLCALELARSGADLKGVVSFHGLLHKPGNLKSEPITAKILVMHGYDDPMVQPDQVHEFCNEMTEANVDWQMHMYGHVQHAFTNPLAHDKQLGTIYNEVAAQRSWQSMTNFLQEIFK
ncbi:dienelactone hydrolase family protein [Legionella cherrii]|uniref:Dienelactone hydrolase n=1 Tax=Legionella cherrii TaxID=28084 RepID=A0A0W0SFN3_9GAMM|nr:dienelactone hydrolase family protein [Legionella cherrii]KTC82166.1 dienelactone hydrolase [Legionella cherrii]VEB33103.1 dienelactone hydrolase [Legionella cherrii]